MTRTTPTEESGPFMSLQTTKLTNPNSIQGGPPGQGQPLVDIEIRVACTLV